MLNMLNRHVVRRQHLRNKTKPRCEEEWHRGRFAAARNCCLSRHCRFARAVASDCSTDDMGVLPTDCTGMFFNQCIEPWEDVMGDFMHPPWADARRPWRRTPFEAFGVGDDATVR